MVLEHFLTKYLSAANPALGDIGAARLTFAQKLELALNPASVLLVIGPGIKQINTLRNQLVHRLEFRLDDVDLEPLRWFIRIRNERVGVSVPGGIELVEEFTKTSCTFLAGAARSIEKQADWGCLVSTNGGETKSRDFKTATWRAKHRRAADGGGCDHDAAAAEAVALTLERRGSTEE